MGITTVNRVNESLIFEKRAPKFDFLTIGPVAFKLEYKIGDYDSETFSRKENPGLKKFIANFESQHCVKTILMPILYPTSGRKSINLKIDIALKIKQWLLRFYWGQSMAVGTAKKN